LRQRALRKLWTTNPALAVLDGLNDYDLDYTDAAMGAGKVISSWSPEGGYAKLEEMAEKVSELASTKQRRWRAEDDDLPVFDDTAPIKTWSQTTTRDAEQPGEAVAAADMEEAKPPGTRGRGDSS
jgi:hypothetical protein